MPCGSLLPQHSLPPEKLRVWMTASFKMNLLLDTQFPSETFEHYLTPVCLKGGVQKKK